MTHLIDKSTLVVEIERRRSKNAKNKLNLAASFEDNYLLSFLDTLEVKEVDFEEYYHEFLQKEWFGNSHVRTVSEMMAFTAKHFYELGLKAQKEENE